MTFLHCQIAIRSPFSALRAFRAWEAFYTPYSFKVTMEIESLETEFSVHK